MHAILRLGFLATSTLLFFASCSSEKATEDYIKFPADEIARDLDAVKNFSIILYDMDVNEEGKHLHKYKIIKQTKETEAISDPALLKDTTATAADLGFEESITDWKEVSPEDFDFHSSDMGMEILTKTDGKLSKIAAPAGYSQYVGNEKYGEWKKDASTGDNFWSFYGRYMFMSSMIHMFMPVPYGHYSAFGAYRGVRPYYGPMNASGGYAYGTGSSTAQRMNPSFTQRINNNSALKNRVNSSVAKSSSRATGGVRTAATTPGGSSSRTSRSTPRYGGTSSRSRTSSGFGK